MANYCKFKFLLFYIFPTNKKKTDHLKEHMEDKNNKNVHRQHGL